MYDSHGKPALSLKFSSIWNLRFNVSHSDGLAIFGVTEGTEIGVDIERTRENIAALAVARRFFSAEESAAIESLPAPEQRQAFYVCWTRKEAFLKAMGHGLSRNLKSFSVSVLPGAPAALLRDDEARPAGVRWDLSDLHAPEGYAAAAAFENGINSAKGHVWGASYR